MRIMLICTLDDSYGKLDTKLMKFTNDG